MSARCRADLRFLQGDVIEGDRLNYRYDAVASAHVSLTPRASGRSRIQQKFKLTLVNGEPISVIVTDLDPDDFQQGETEQSLERATLDAASVANTLHVLKASPPKERPGSRNGGRAMTVMWARACVLLVAVCGTRKLLTASPRGVQQAPPRCGAV